MFEELSLFSGCGSRRAASGCSMATVRNLGQDLQLEDRVVASVSFGYNSGRIHTIAADGVNLLNFNSVNPSPSAKGGVYLIGSFSGNDNPTTNMESQGSNGSVMTNGGPTFRLTFWQKGPGVLGFRAEIGAPSRPVSEMNMAFDFNKQLFGTFAFNGSRYFHNRSTSPINYSSGAAVNYSSIPQIHEIRQNGPGTPIVARAGEANTREPTSWGEIRGSLATVRVNVFSSERYRSMDFTNHTGTNNIALGFRSLNVGQTARAEGEIVVTQPPPRTWMFQTETHNWHQTGVRDGSAHRVRAGIDPAQRFMSFGPYTTDITPGQRTATFRLMADNASGSNRVLTLDVFDANSGRVIASRDISRRDFGTAMQYRDFTLGFTASAGQRLEFRTYWHGGTSVWQDYVQVR